MIEDIELVERAKSGDAAAFGELVRRYHLDIRSFLRRRINDTATADDLAQDVFLGAMSAIERLQQTGSVRSWLISIARFKLIDFWRTESRRKTTNSNIDIALENESMDEPSDNRFDGEVLATLKQCMAGLKPNARHLINDYYFGEVAATEIAARLNQKSSTVRMTLLRIRKALAKCIRKRLGVDFEL